MVTFSTAEPCLLTLPWLTCKWFVFSPEMLDFALNLGDVDLKVRLQFSAYSERVSIRLGAFLRAIEYEFAIRARKHHIDFVLASIAVDLRFTTVNSGLM